MSVAVIAAHPDDEVLGCGGTIARMAREGHEVHILLMADGETSRKAPGSITWSPQPKIDEAVYEAMLDERDRAANSAREIMGCATVETMRLSDNRMDGRELLDIIKIVERFLELWEPSVVFTHYGGDVNVDHQAVHNAVITACRPQPGHSVEELLFFEVPSSTEWQTPSLFAPNWFVDISNTLSVKMEALMAYESELREFPHPRSLRAVSALAQWRGATVGVKAAEAFVLGRKLVK